MSRAAAQRSRKRRGDGAQEGAPATRRHRLLGPSNFAAVRSFGLRGAVANSPRSPCCRRKCRLIPSQFSPVRSFGLRVALATGPRRRRKRCLVDVRHAVLTPLRRRRHSGLLPRARYFPGLRPFALRFLLATGASAPRRCRKPALLHMGNYISQLFGKNTSDDGLEVQRERVQVARMESELEAEKGDVMRRGLGYWSVPAFDLRMVDILRDSLDQIFFLYYAGKGTKQVWETQRNDKWNEIHGKRPKSISWEVSNFQHCYLKEVKFFDYQATASHLEFVRHVAIRAMCLEGITLMDDAFDSFLSAGSEERRTNFKSKNYRYKIDHNGQNRMIRLTYTKKLKHPKRFRYVPRSHVGKQSTSWCSFSMPRCSK